MADEQGPQAEGPPAKGSAQPVVPDTADQQEQDEQQRNKEAQQAYLEAQGPQTPDSAAAGEAPATDSTGTAEAPPAPPTTPEAAPAQPGSTTENPNEDILGRGISDAALNTGKAIYGVASNLGEAAGLWRGPHGKYTTQADVDNSPIVKRLEAEQLKEYGAPHSTVEKLATGLVAIGAATAVTGPGGMLKTAASFSVVSHPGDIVHSLSSLPYVGGIARTVFQTLHLESSPTDAYAIAQLKDMGSFVLTEIAAKPLAAAVSKGADLLGLKVPTPAVERDPPVKATVTAGPDGNFQMALERVQEGHKFVSIPSNFEIGKARQAAGQVFASEKAAPIPLPGMSQGQAEAVGASIEHASIAHEAADKVESGTPLLSNIQHDGVQSLARDLATTGGQDATGIITNFRLHDAVPYLADPEHMGSLLDEMTGALEHHTMDDDAIGRAVTDIHPNADEQVIARVTQAVRGSEKGQAVLGAMQTATRMQAHTVQSLAQAAEAAPGNVIGQANLASATDFAMQVSVRIQNLFEKGDASWTKGAGTARGFNSEGILNPTPKQAAASEVTAESLNGPEDATAKTEAENALKALQKVRTNDTDASTATAMGLSKARAAAQRVIKNAEGKPWEPPKDPFVRQVQANENAEKINTGAEAQREEPLEATDEQKAAAKANARPANPINTLSQTLDAEEKKLQHIVDTINNGKEQTALSPEEQLEKNQINPVEGYIKTGGPVQFGPGGSQTQEAIEDYQRKVLGLKPDEDLPPGAWESLQNQLRLSNGNPETVLKMIRDAQDQTAAATLSRTTKPDVVPFGLTAQYARALGQTANITMIGNIVSRVGTISKIFLSGLANIMTEASAKALGALPTNPLSAATWVVNGGRTGPLLRGYNAQLMRSSWESIYFGVSHLGDGFQLAKASLVDGGSRLAPQAGGVINSPVPQGFGWLHSLSHITSSIHIATSEINRAIDYFGNVKSEATAKAMQDGLTGKALSDRVAMDVKFSQTPEGYGLNADARNSALRNTNTRPLPYGSLGQVMSNNANSSIVARQMFKIIRMPINELKYIGETTPFIGQFIGQTQSGSGCGWSESPDGTRPYGVWSSCTRISCPVGACWGIDWWWTD